MFYNVLRNKKHQDNLTVKQANLYYNYTLGFDVISLDLVKTAGRLLSSGIAKSVFFSDFNCLYLNDENKVKHIKLDPKGRFWDSSWDLKFDGEIPDGILLELTGAVDISFHENKFVRDCGSYIRASLPPVILEKNGERCVLYPGVKIYSDGISVLYFQFDGTWGGISHDIFLSTIVNLYNRYFDDIWIYSKIQCIDGEVALEDSFDDLFSIGGDYIDGRDIRKLKKKMRDDSRKFLTDSLSQQGQIFSFGEGVDWNLHKIAGTENNEGWESTIDMCRSMYSNAISTILVSKNNFDKVKSYSYMWQGRPSVSLLRFDNQPDNKSKLIRRFSDAMNSILNRASIVESDNSLPSDLRKFDDYCLHSNRSIYLWTWLKHKDEPDDVWDDPNTRTKICENQARVEQVEYHNMSISRACSWAHNPPRDLFLFESYSVLANTNNDIHHSSISGEVSDALAYMIKSFGTESLITPAKEMARFRLDELKYKSDSIRSHSNYWLTFVFGLVGVTSFAEFVVNPMVVKKLSEGNEIFSPFLSFGLSAIIIIFISAVIWIVTKNRM